MIVIVPSRGRPQNIQRLANLWQETKVDAKLLVAIDEDDGEMAEYVALHKANPYFDLQIGPRLRLGLTLNNVATSIVDSTDIIGFMGDDHFPRTPEWERTIQNVLDEMKTGIVYGNDLFQGENLPTAVFMTSNIVKNLGYMSPPGLIHLYIDDAWKTLGEKGNCLRYLPDVIIEHIHPAAGKTDGDAGYAEANSNEVSSHDHARFDEWCINGELDDAVSKVLELKGS